MNRKTTIIFLFSILISLLLVLLLGPKQDESPDIGFNLKIYYKNNTCFHIHHWMYMLLLIFIIVSSVLISKGSFNNSIFAILGILIGASLGNLKYSDWYQIKKPCKKPLKNNKSIHPV